MADPKAKPAELFGVPADEGGGEMFGVPAGGGEAAPEKPGFLSSAWDTIKRGPGNLMGMGNAIIEGVPHLLDGSATNPLARMGQQTIDLGKDAGGAFKRGDVIGGVRKSLNTGINAVAPGLGAQSEEAGREFDKGNTAAGFGKTLGVGVNTALGLGAPKIARGGAEVVSNAPRAIGALGTGAKAAAPGLATGGALVAAGEGLAQIPGMGYPARIGMGLPGATMIGRALRQGAAATREAFSGPSTTSPEATIGSRASGPGPLPSSGAREVVIQHRGDPRLPGRAPQTPELFDSFGRPLPRRNLWE